MKAAIRPGRIIVHLSSYDDSFVARKRDWTPLKRVLIAIGLTPAAAVLIIPSFQLGRLAFKTPSFSLPDELRAGEAFALPAIEEISNLSVQGRSLAALALAKPMYFGVIGPESPPTLMIEASFKREALAQKTTLAERYFLHPTVSYFKKAVRVRPVHAETLALRLPARIAGNYENEEADHINTSSGVLTAAQTVAHASAQVTAAGGTAKAAQAAAQAAAKINVTCWKSPLAAAVMMPFGAELKRPGAPADKARYQHLGVDLRSNPGQAVGSAGPGVVFAVASEPPPGRTVTISHGGGLYTRYAHLKDSGVVKGERVNAGQTIGWAGPTRRFDAPRLHWEVFFDKKPLDPQSFLALSSQLCDLK